MNLELFGKILNFARHLDSKQISLFNNSNYSLFIRRVGTDNITITKAGPDEIGIPPMENDGRRISTFNLKYSDFVNHNRLTGYRKKAFDSLVEDISLSRISKDSISKEMLKVEILSLISKRPMSIGDFRKAIQDSDFEISEYDDEETGHGRERWKTNLQNAIQDLKLEGKIGHLKRNQYISPIVCSNPLDPISFWLEVLENSNTKYSDEAICEWEHNEYGHGIYLIRSVSSNKITFRREPLSGNKKIDIIKFDKKRVIGMANSLNAVGGKGNRVTIGGNREVYSELLTCLSSSIEIIKDKWIEITDTVVKSSSNFVLDDLNSHKDLRKRAIKPGIQREGAANFRKKVLENYQNKCAITGISIVDAIQAAHIRPYNGPQTNHLANGMALRSDIHRLFDLGKIRINPEDYNIILHPDIESEYRSICFEKLDLRNVLIPPNKAALELLWGFEKNKWF